MASMLANPQSSPKRTNSERKSVLQEQREQQQEDLLDDIEMTRDSMDAMDLDSNGEARDEDDTSASMQAKIEQFTAASPSNEDFPQWPAPLQSPQGETYKDCWCTKREGNLSDDDLDMSSREPYMADMVLPPSDMNALEINPYLAAQLSLEAEEQQNYKTNQRQLRQQQQQQQYFRLLQQQRKKKKKEEEAEEAREEARGFWSQCCGSK